MIIMTMISGHKITKQNHDLNSQYVVDLYVMGCQFWKAILVHPKFLTISKAAEKWFVNILPVLHHPPRSRDLQGLWIFSAPETSMEMQLQWEKKDTPWKINMEHNNGGLEDDIPFQLGDF